MKRIIEYFKENTKINPNKIAIVSDKINITYKQLYDVANNYAEKLLNNGVESQDVVAVYTLRDIDTICWLLAVIKVEAIYLPIDPELPQERIDYMCRISNTKAIINLERDIIDYKGYYEGINRYDKFNDNIVYIIFTSGTSGNPKGVMIEEHSVINLVEAFDKKIYVDRDVDAIGMISPMYFDACIKQIFYSLCYGKTLHIISDRMKSHPTLLVQYLNMNKIDAIDGTPSYWNVVVKSIKVHNTNIYSRYILLGGENINNGLIIELYKHITSSSAIINLYGPTECCVDTTFFIIDKDTINKYGCIPIGKSLPNCNVIIMDEDFNEVKSGDIGEICISGYGIARGYVGINSENFIVNKITNEKMYKTGDLGRLFPDGNIEYIGRKDNQIKVNGYRVELDEIEKKACNYNGINMSVAIKKRKNNIDYIELYFLSSIDINMVELKEYLLKNLPKYMVPRKLTKLDKLPLTHNGKIDRDYLSRGNTC